MTTNKKKLLLPSTMAKAGWDVLIGRDDIEAVPYEPYITMPDLQAALRDTDGIALSLTPLKAPEIAVADRLRVLARIGVGYDARSEEHTSELQSRQYLVCRLLLEKKKKETLEIERSSS